MISKLKNILLQVLLAYALLVAAAYGFQRHLMYHPEGARFDPVQMGMTELEPIDTPIQGIGTLRHWTAPPQRAGAPTIVYFQGNTGGLDRWQFKFREWMEKGFGVLLVGYPGYGNPGEPSEAGLYASGRAALEAWRNSFFGDRPYVLYGFSLGSGVATQIAIESNPLALVLEAPYSSFADVGQAHYPYLPVKWLIKDRYDTLAKIAKVKAPVLVVHGLSDEVIPVEEGKRVFEAANEPKSSYFPAMAHHNDLYDFRTEQVVTDFINAL